VSKNNFDHNILLQRDANLLKQDILGKEFAFLCQTLHLGNAGSTMIVFKSM